MKTTVLDILKFFVLIFFLISDQFKDQQLWGGKKKLKFLLGINGYVCK